MRNLSEFLGVGACILALCGACKEPDGTSVEEDREKLLSASAELVSAAIGNLEVDSEIDCGRDDVSGFPSELFAVTIEQCLECRDVGWMLREHARQMRDGSRQRDIWLAVPSSDLSDVCQYLRQERASSTVVAIGLPDHLLSPVTRFNEMWFIRFGADGAILRTVTAPTGQDMLDSLSSSPIVGDVDGRGQQGS